MDTSKLSRQYAGKVARDYDQKRTSEKKWITEQEVVRGLLAQIPRGSRILDIPVGTGRFISFYKELHLQATGVDVSHDMLAESEKKVKEKDFDMLLKQGSIFNLDFANEYFDVVLCIRFLNWIDYDNLNVAVSELARVSRRNLIVGIRHLTQFNDMEVCTPLGMMRFIRQCRMRLRKSFEKQKLVFHKKRDIESLFEKYNLKVSEAAHVEKRADGTDYFIYLLRKEQQGD
jgi:ubiquinone/menaquinone biosynthesis C-methylase UbiE